MHFDTTPVLITYLFSLIQYILTGYKNHILVTNAHHQYKVKTANLMLKRSHFIFTSEVSHISLVRFNYKKVNKIK